jgi:hypothetical protein
MKSFLDFSLRKFLLASFLWTVFPLSIYLAQTAAAASFYARYKLADDAERNWHFLNQRVGQQKLPSEILHSLEGLRNAPRAEVFRKIMSIRKTVTYENIPIASTLTPYEVMKKGKGDCDDIAYLWYHQLWELGIPAKVLFVTIDNGNEPYLHAVTLTADENGSPVVLDINSLWFVTQSFDSWLDEHQAHILFEGYGQTFKRSDSMYEASLF